MDDTQDPFQSHGSPEAIVGDHTHSLTSCVKNGSLTALWWPLGTGRQASITLQLEMDEWNCEGLQRFGLPVDPFVLLQEILGLWANYTHVEISSKSRS